MKNYTFMNENVLGLVTTKTTTNLGQIFFCKLPGLMARAQLRKRRYQSGRTPRSMSQKRNKRTRFWGTLLIPRWRRWNCFAVDQIRERLKCQKSGAPPELFLPFFPFPFNNPVKMHLFTHSTIELERVAVR